MTDHNDSIAPWQSLGAVTKRLIHGKAVEITASDAGVRFATARDCPPLSDKERRTILAALRFWQRWTAPRPRGADLLSFGDAEDLIDKLSVDPVDERDGSHG